MRTYLLALSFLTVIPININYTATEKQMERTLIFYPVVGITLGLVIAGFSWLFNYLDMGLAGDTLVVIFLVILTGGLHMDGLMDTADGIMSGKDREMKLEIMKDSRVGAMGALACVSIIILKISLLSIIPFPQKLSALILAPALARWSFAYGIIKYPYARSKPGLGSIYGENKKNITLMLATIIVIIAAYLTFNWQGIILAVAVFIFIVMINKVFVVFLGGLTGDTYGAAGELVETWVFLCAALLVKVVFILG